MHEARIPPASVFASLLFFTRIEMNLIPIPPHIAEGRYRTRHEAALAGYLGITLEDMFHFSQRCRTRFSDFPAVDVDIQSQLLDMILGQPTPYILGSLSGDWQGSFIVVQEEYMQWKKILAAPIACQTFRGRSPLYLTFQEHYTCDVRSMVSMDDIKNGHKNAWLPAGIKFYETANGVAFTDGRGSIHSTYKTVRHGESLCVERKDIVDVIITGKTADLHAAAWGATRVFGRVRLADGLFVIFNESLDGRREPQLLRGSVASSQNLVGRIKDTLTTGYEPADSESVFSLCKDHAR